MLFDFVFVFNLEGEVASADTKGQEINGFKVHDMKDTKVK